MKAFFVGLLVVILASALWTVGIFVFPLLSGILGIVLIPVLLVLAIWLVGKLVLYLKEKIK